MHRSEPPPRGMMWTTGSMALIQTEEATLNDRGTKRHEQAEHPQEHDERGPQAEEKARAATAKVQPAEL